MHLLVWLGFAVASLAPLAARQHLDPAPVVVIVRTSDRGVSDRDSSIPSCAVLPAPVAAAGNKRSHRAGGNQ